MKEFRFNVVKEERKALVKAISEILNISPQYMGAPSFAFVVGSYNISRDGTVTIEGELDNDVLNDLLLQIEKRGFSYELDSIDNVGVFSIDVPICGMTPAIITNIEKMVNAKAWILKKMVGTESLPIEQLNDRLCFPWFKVDASSEEISAYTSLISQLCAITKNKKRIIAEEKPPKPDDNEKYKARCFLLTLEFKGSAYSQARKILLSPFSGNGSFLQGNRKKDVSNSCTEMRSDESVSIHVGEMES